MNHQPLTLHRNAGGHRHPSRPDHGRLAPLPLPGLSPHFESDGWSNLKFEHQPEKQDQHRARPPGRWRGSGHNRQSVAGRGSVRCSAGDEGGREGGGGGGVLVGGGGGEALGGEEATTGGAFPGPPPCGPHSREGASTLNPKPQTPNLQLETPNKP